MLNPPPTSFREFSIMIKSPSIDVSTCDGDNDSPQSADTRIGLAHRVGCADARSSVGAGADGTHSRILHWGQAG